jgi:transposase
MNMQLVMKCRENGMTYDKIAAKFNVSRQCVHQAVQAYEKFKVKESACVYDDLRQWMNENHVRISQFCKMDEFNGKNAYSLRRYLKGDSEIPMSVIDIILKVTGLTYEEAFGMGMSTDEMDTQ